MVTAGDHQLAAAGIPRAVRVGGVEYIVRAPTVREAVEAFTILREAVETPESERLLAGVLERWWGPRTPPPSPSRWWKRFRRVRVMPSGLYEAWLLSPPSVRLATLSTLLFAGVELEDRKDDPDATPEGEADPEDPATWEAMLGAFVEAYGGDPWTVYNETPFPFFLALFGSAARQLALRSLRDIQATSIPYAGAEASKVVARLQRSAGVSTKPKSTGRKPPEVIDRDWNRLLGLAGNG